jgi:hypothetical protein
MKLQVSASRFPSSLAASWFLEAVFCKQCLMSNHNTPTTIPDGLDDCNWTKWVHLGSDSHLIPSSSSVTLISQKTATPAPLQSPTVSYDRNINCVLDPLDHDIPSLSPLTPCV